MFKTEISLIVPVYRVAKYLDKCLDSLLNQRYDKPYNIILVETGSDDGSDLICERYQKENYGKVYWFHYPKRYSVSMARNLGLLHSNGRFVSFVDGDDIVDENFLSLLHNEFLKDEQLQVVFAGYDIVFEEGKRKKGFSGSFCGRGRTVLKKYFLHKPRFRGYCWGGLYRKSFLYANRLFFDSEMSLYEDELFVSKCLFDANKVKFISSIGYHYCYHCSSTMNTSKDWLTPHLDCYKKIFSYIEKTDSEYASSLFRRCPGAQKKQLKLDCKNSFLHEKMSKKDLFRKSLESYKEIAK